MPAPSVSDLDMFSVEAVCDPQTQRRPAARAGARRVHPGTRHLGDGTSRDPPEHPRVRAVIPRAISPAVIKRMREDFVREAEAHVERLLAPGGIVELDGRHDIASPFVETGEVGVVPALDLPPADLPRHVADELAALVAAFHEAIQRLLQR